jgi:hypothetical protein
MQEPNMAGGCQDGTITAQLLFNRWGRYPGGLFLVCEENV